MEQARSRTHCLLCGKYINPQSHACIKEPWVSHYGLYEEEIDVVVLQQSLKKCVHSVKNKFDKKEPVSIWDFAGVLPIPKKISLGEGGTPLHKLDKYCQNAQCDIYVKNEGVNPSHVFKDRESSVAINRCLRDGFKKIFLASTGNAAQSISLYANQVGIEPFLFISDRASKDKIATMINNRARLIILKDSYMEDAFTMSCDLTPFLEEHGIKNCNPGIDWLRREGDKTIAFELMAQLSRVPDWIILACGNGSSTHGILKGFKELKQAGIIDRLPKMVGVQIKGGDPIPQGVKKKQMYKPIEIPNAPLSLGDSAVASFDYIAAVQAIIESGGLGVSVDDSQMAQCVADYVTLEPELLDVCIPEVVTSETLAALDTMIENKLIIKGETVVLFFSSHGVNSKDHLRELLESYGYMNEWKILERYLSQAIVHNNYENLSDNNNVRVVSKNPSEVKEAVLELLA